MLLRRLWLSQNQKIIVSTNTAHGEWVVEILSIVSLQLTLGFCSVIPNPEVGLVAYTDVTHDVIESGTVNDTV